MLPKSFASEVNFIDAFLAQPKTLDGAPPEFGKNNEEKDDVFGRPFGR